MGGIICGGRLANQAKSYPHNVGTKIALVDLLRGYSGPISVLDLCCGAGQFLHQLAGDRDAQIYQRLEYTGVDLDDTCIRLGQEYAALNREFTAPPQFIKQNVVAYLQHAPDAKFDLVCLVNAFHELPKESIHRFMHDMFRVARDRGVVYIFDIARLKYDEQEPGATPLSADDINHLLALWDSFSYPTSVYLGQYVRAQGYTNDEYQDTGWWLKIECDEKIRGYRPPQTFKQRFMDVLSTARHAQCLTAMQEVLRRKKATLDANFRDLAQEWIKKYDPNNDKPSLRMGLNNQLRLIHQYKPPPHDLVTVENSIDSVFRDSWACEYELKNLQDLSPAP